MIVLGVWVALLPFLGFPSSWRTPMFAMAGLVIALLAFLLRREFRERKGTDSRTSFAQNGSPRMAHEISKDTNPFAGEEGQN